MSTERAKNKKLHPIECSLKLHLLVRNVGKKCHLASSLDSYGELSLVESTVAANTSGENLCSLRGELSKLSDILVIDLGNLILAEDANLLSSVCLTVCRTLIVFHEFITFPTHDFYIASTTVSQVADGRVTLIRREGSRRREFLRNQHFLCCCKRVRRMQRECMSVPEVCPHHRSEKRRVLRS